MRTRRVLGHLSPPQLAARVWREVNEDNIFGAAAQLAYYLLLSLFPLLIFVTSLVGFLPSAQQAIMSELTEGMPREATALVVNTLADVVRHSSRGLISFGLLAALVAASSGVAALMDTLNVAFEARERRSFWKIRFTSIVLTLALSFFILVGAGLIMFANRLGNAVAESVGAGTRFGHLGGALDYLAGLTALLFGVQLVYYFAPDKKQQWKWITPGAVFAVAGFVFASMLFSIYLRVAPSYSATYGSLGAAIVLMLWLYLVSFVVLVGGEIDREIEKAIRANIVAQRVPPRAAD